MDRLGHSDHEGKTFEHQHPAIVDCTAAERNQDHVKDGSSGYLEKQAFEEVKKADNHTLVSADDSASGSGSAVKYPVLVPSIVRSTPNTPSALCKVEDEKAETTGMGATLTLDSKPSLFKPFHQNPIPLSADYVPIPSTTDPDQHQPSSVPRSPQFPFAFLASSSYTTRLADSPPLDRSARIPLKRKREEKREDSNLLKTSNLVRKKIPWPLPPTSPSVADSAYAGSTSVESDYARQRAKSKTEPIAGGNETAGGEIFSSRELEDNTLTLRTPGPDGTEKPEPWSPAPQPRRSPEFRRPVKITPDVARSLLMRITQEMQGGALRWASRGGYSGSVSGRAVASLAVDSNVLPSKKEPDKLETSNGDPPQLVEASVDHKLGSRIADAMDVAVEAAFTLMRGSGGNPPTPGSVPCLSWAGKASPSAIRHQLSESQSYPRRIAYARAAASDPQTAMAQTLLTRVNAVSMRRAVGMAEACLKALFRLIIESQRWVPNVNELPIACSASSLLEGGEQADRRTLLDETGTRRKRLRNSFSEDKERSGDSRGKLDIDDNKKDGAGTSFNAPGQESRSSATTIKSTSLPQTDPMPIRTAVEELSVDLKSPQLSVGSASSTFTPLSSSPPTADEDLPPPPSPRATTPPSIGVLSGLDRLFPPTAAVHMEEGRNDVDADDEQNISPEVMPSPLAKVEPPRSGLRDTLTAQAPKVRYMAALAASDWLRVPGCPHVLRYALALVKRMLKAAALSTEVIDIGMEGDRRGSVVMQTDDAKLSPMNALPVSLRSPTRLLLAALMLAHASLSDRPISNATWTRVYASCLTPGVTDDQVALKTDVEENRDGSVEEDRKAKRSDLARMKMDALKLLEFRVWVAMEEYCAPLVE
ncbi:hypothetical protein HDU96_001969 [Phlyctochytrium bullatum]|nr:hypothetical protein HDU96_001969 [Phlyctochytrium bullatum]